MVVKGNLPYEARTSARLPQSEVRVCLICDSRIIRAALQEYLSNRGIVVPQSLRDEGDLPVALAGGLGDACDVIVLVVAGSQAAFVSKVRRALELADGVSLVVIAERISQQAVYTCLRLGAKAFISLDGEPEDLIRAVSMASQHKVYMSTDVTELVISGISQSGRARAEHAPHPGALVSSREIEIIQMLCEGLSTKEIARRLHISFKTVENHRYNIYRKSGVENIASLFRYAVQNNMVAI